MDLVEVMDKMTKDLLENAKEQREEVLNQDRITGYSPNHISAIHIVDGEEVEVVYDTYGGCMSCPRLDTLASGQSGCCPICDGLMTEKEYYQKFPKKELSPYKQIIERQKSEKIATEEIFAVEKSQPIDTQTSEASVSKDVGSKKLSKAAENPKVKVLDITPNHEKKEYPIQKQDNGYQLPSKEDIDAHVAVYDYVKKKVVDTTDFIKIGKKQFLKKSGVKKFRPWFIESLINFPCSIVSLSFCRSECINFFSIF